MGEELEIKRSGSTVTHGRMGVAMLTQHHIARRGTEGAHPLPEPKAVHQAIHRALKDDTRVGHLADLPPDTRYTNLTFAMAPPRESAGGEVPLSPLGHMHVLTFGDPIVFSIRVAKRLQPLDRGARAVPSEEYWASWDGIQLFVAWRPDSDSDPHGYYGGFLVLDVLRDALEASDVYLYVQSCGSNCNYPFAHENMRIEAVDPDAEMSLRPGGGGTSTVITRPASSDGVLMRRIARHFKFTTRVFARMRANGSVIWTVERRARTELAEVLALQVDDAHAAALGFWQGLTVRWKQRGNRKKSAELIARLWVEVATLEYNKREWDEAKYLFDSSAERSGQGGLFRAEYPDEVNSVSGLDVSYLRESVSQMSSRADNRGVISATTRGAVAGAIVGALIGGLFVLVGNVAEQSKPAPAPTVVIQQSGPESS